MVGIVKVDTLQNNAGTSSVGMDYVVNGSAKGWVSYTMVSSGSVQDSLNISSLSDLGGGAAKPTYTASFANTNYCQTMGMGDYSITWSNSHALAHSSNGYKTTSYTHFNTSTATVNSGADLYENGIVMHGDLA